MMYHAYELEKNKRHHEKQALVTKKNKKFMVNNNFLEKFKYKTLNNKFFYTFLERKKRFRKTSKIC